MCGSKDLVRSCAAVALLSRPTGLPQTQRKILVAYSLAMRRGRVRGVPGGWFVVGPVGCRSSRRAGVGGSLLDAMVQAGVKHIVFSSTAAVYGSPHTSPILETFPIQAVNAYGESKA